MSDDFMWNLFHDHDLKTVLQYSDHCDEQLVIMQRKAAQGHMLLRLPDFFPFGFLCKH